MEEVVGARLATMLALGILVTGCASDRPGRPSFDAAANRLPIGEVTLAPDEIAWSVGKTLHVGDRVYRADRRIDRFVVGIRGVYFVSGGALHFTDLVDEQQALDGRVADVTLSSDGRYLGFLDFTTMPATTVAFDLDTGRELVRTPIGMGDSDDDLADLYEDAEPHFLGFDHEAAFSKGVDHAVYRAPLDGSAPSVERKDIAVGGDLPMLPPPGIGVGFSSEFTEDLPEPLARTTLGGEFSPGRDYALYNVANSRLKPFSMRTERWLRVSLGKDRNRFLIGGWLDDHRVYGAAGTSRGVNLGPTASVVVCDLRLRACRDVAGPFSLPRNWRWVQFPSRDPF